MANAGGLVIVLVAGLFGLGLAIGACSLIVYGLTARDPDRGAKASLWAFGLAALAALLSEPFWSVVITGRGSHGESVEYRDMVPFVILVAVEALALAASLVGIIRQRRRRGRRSDPASGA